DAPPRARRAIAIGESVREATARAGGTAIVVLTVILVASLAAVGAEAQKDLPSTAVLPRLHPRLLPIFHLHYPKIRSKVAGDSIEFDYDTRKFLIHYPSKTGEWQDAYEVKGPNPHGILCHIKLVQGRYQGAAMLPQTFDDRYFKTYAMA